MTSRILFVCLGNICRSPAAEAVFRQMAPEVETDSAGTGHWHVGEPPYADMQTSAKRRGVHMDDLRARLFKAVDFSQFDLIIAMDDANLRDIEALRPQGNQTPVRLFTDYASATGMGHIPDPYYTRDFEGVLDLIETAAQGLNDSL